MKMVTLYRIQKDEMPIPHGDRIEWCRTNRATPFLLEDGDSPHEVTVEHKFAPVERICKHEVDPRTREVKTKEWYIAVEPGLKDLLTLDYKRKLEEASTKIAELKNQLHNKEWLSRSWWAQPWYKRVWSAIFS